MYFVSITHIVDGQVSRGTSSVHVLLLPHTYLGLSTQVATYSRYPGSPSSPSEVITNPSPAPRFDDDLARCELPVWQVRCSLSGSITHCTDVRTCSWSTQLLYYNCKVCVAVLPPPLHVSSPYTDAVEVHLTSVRMYIP